jgi:hypothetical protein
MNKMAVSGNLRISFRKHRVKGEDMNSRENSIVFTPARIGQLEIKNRLVRSATYENAATKGGEISEFLFDLYRALARGDVGLIITSVAGVYSISCNACLPVGFARTSCRVKNP